MAENLEKKVEKSEGLVRGIYNSLRSAANYLDNLILGRKDGHGAGVGMPWGYRRNQNPCLSMFGQGTELA